jgi:hypothetical protein
MKDVTFSVLKKRIRYLFILYFKVLVKKDGFLYILKFGIFLNILINKNSSKLYKAIFLKL